MTDLTRQAAGRGWRYRCALLTTLAVYALAPQLARSVEATDHLNVQEPAAPSYLTAPPAGSFRLPPIDPLLAPPVPERTETVLINHIVFRGNAVISTSELDALAAPYLGKRLNEADLEALRLKLTRYYIDQGYINSGALFGNNALTGDTLTIDIVEGRLQAIRLAGMERLDDDYVSKRLSRDPEAVLNIDQLRERFQLLLDDPLFKRMNARMTPGTKLGEAILEVDVERARPYQLSAYANNYRPPSIGTSALGLSGWVRNLTGHGDYLEATIQGSSEDSRSTRNSIGWFMPLNTLGTQLSVQYYREQSVVVEEPLTSLDIKSIQDSLDVGLSQTFIETLNHRLTLGLNFVDRKNRTSVGGIPFSFIQGEPSGETKVSAWRFWQEYSYRSERQVFAARSTYISARNNLQDIVGLPATTVVPFDHQYGFWLGQVQYARQLADNGTQIILRGTTQQTSHKLLPLDQMSIGGVYTVRGYRENQLIRDKGNILNIELDYPLVRQPGDGFNFSVIPFYDVGRGQDQHGPATTISSVGVATRLRWKGVRLDVSMAKRLSHPDYITSSGGTLQDKGIELQLAYDFF